MARIDWPPYARARLQLHALWSKAAAGNTDYDKREWQELADAIGDIAILCEQYGLFKSGVKDDDEPGGAQHD